MNFRVSLLTGIAVFVGLAVWKNNKSIDLIFESNVEALTGSGIEHIYTPINPRTAAYIKTPNSYGSCDGFLGIGGPHDDLLEYSQCAGEICCGNFIAYCTTVDGWDERIVVEPYYCPQDNTRVAPRP